MNCPKCHEAVAPDELVTPSAGEKMRTLLTDWRVWALAVGVNVAAGITGALLHLGSGAGVAAGGGVGVVLAIRVGRLRRCPHCGTVASFPVSLQ